jgi:hypothetical protein
MTNPIHYLLYVEVCRIHYNDLIAYFCDEKTKGASRFFKYFFANSTTSLKDAKTPL